MKTINKIKVYGVVALLGASSMVSAQEDATNYMNREMTLEREYDPSVQDANKVNTLPVIKEPEVRKIPIDYASFALPTDPMKEIHLLSSGNILTDISYNKKRGYLNLAGGTYMNLNGDAGYHILSSDKDQLNIFFSHRSTHGKLQYLQNEEKIKAKLNDNLGGLNFRHHFEKASFKLGAHYGYSTFNYYGLPLDISIPTATGIINPKADRETKQVNQTIHFYTGIASRTEDAPIGYLFDLAYTNFSYKYGFNEKQDGPTEHSLNGKFDINIPVLTDQRVGLSGNINYFNYNQPAELIVGDVVYATSFENYMEATLSPYYKMDGGSWHVHLGVNAMFFTGDNKKFMASPNVFADVEVADKTVLYAQATGKLQSNSLYEVSRINRYINPNTGYVPSRNWLDSKVGLKSGVAPGFWFDVFGGYKIISDDYLFISGMSYLDNDFGGQMAAAGDMDSKLLFAGVQFKYNYQQLFDMHLKAVYNHWTTELDSDWDESYKEYEISSLGRPRFEFNAGLIIRPIHKLSLALDYNLATDRYALYGGNQFKLKNINELNLTASYTVNDTFGAYVKLNNLLFQKYELYYGYPMQEFNVMAGININF